MHVYMCDKVLLQMRKSGILKTLLGEISCLRQMRNRAAVGGIMQNIGLRSPSCLPSPCFAFPPKFLLTEKKWSKTRACFLNKFLSNIIEILRSNILTSSSLGQSCFIAPFSLSIFCPIGQNYSLHYLYGKVRFRVSLCIHLT